ncbi:Endoglucanase EG-II [Ptychographa xylographoides]|nr:Endoglucanase EG-II [Ptychographa xylographoides]
MLTAFLVVAFLTLSFDVAVGDVQFRGVNIAGFDFGCTIDGTCITSSVYAPLARLQGPDGAGQMLHFTSNDGMNIFRLPVGWQYLVNGVLGGTLDQKGSADYDLLVQACLATGSYCLIDIHNYGRWDGNIVGQAGGPTNEQFASLWGQLGTKYAAESKIVFGIMNEPHDMPDIDGWAQSVQAAVTAIRTAGARSQMILLPGNDYTSAESFVSGGSAAALGKVTNLDGSITNLIFDVHKYLDSDGSGTHVGCVSNQIDTSFSPLAQYLRTNKRQALLSETGGGSADPSCLTNVCELFTFIEANSDVYLGYLGWAAGSFGTDYILSMTPFGSAAEGWTDQKLMSQCFAANSSGRSTLTATAASAASTALLSTSTWAYTFSPAPVLSMTTSTSVPTSTTSTSITSITGTSSWPYTFSPAPTSVLSSLFVDLGKGAILSTSTVVHPLHIHNGPSGFSTVTTASGSAVAKAGARETGGNMIGDDECLR